MMDAREEYAAAAALNCSQDFRLPIAHGAAGSLTTLSRAEAPSRARSNQHSDSACTASAGVCCAIAGVHPWKLHS